MKFLQKMFKNLLISILNTVFTVFILYFNVTTIINAFQTPDADWNQVFIYLACSVVILIIMWFMAFLKMIRNIAIFILVLLLALWCALPQFLPNLNKNSDQVTTSVGISK